MEKSDMFIKSVESLDLGYGVVDFCFLFCGFDINDLSSWHILNFQCDKISSDFS